MTVALSLLCSQASCPLNEDGTCLDGFDDPSECPNVGGPVSDNSASSALSDDLSDLEFDRNGVDTDEADLPHETLSVSPTSYIGGDQALSLTAANDIAAMAPSTVVLVAGDFASGKTTLVVELWAQFLDGPVADWNFAGSRPLVALDRRHQPSRVSSGRAEATTERTRDDDMRLLHLELADDAGSYRNLLLSDVKGEFFGDLIAGRSVDEAVPLAKRADLCVLVIDGSKASDTAARSECVWRSRLLLGALTEDGGLVGGTRLLIAVSKSDLLAEPEKSSLQALISPVLTFAEGRGLRPEIVFISARPEKAEDEPQGLQFVLKWMTREDRIGSSTDLEPRVNAERFFWKEEIE